jgi:hypothetical protein
MRTNVETRVRDLEDAILLNEKEPNRLKRVCSNILLAKTAVEQTMAEVQSDPEFQEREEVQIHFHRHQLPVLLSKWVYFRKCYVLECILLSSTGDNKQRLLNGHLQEAKDFFLAYRGFIQYYFSQDQQLDKDFFAIQSTVTYLVVENDDELPTHINFGCKLASYLLAYLEFARLLVTEIDGERIERVDSAPRPDIIRKGKIIDYIELGYLLYASETFYVDGKPATQKFIFEQLEIAFGIPPGNFSQRITELRRRQEPLETIAEWIRMANAHLGNLPDDRPRRKLR